MELPTVRYKLEVPERSGSDSDDKVCTALNNPVISKPNNNFKSSFPAAGKLLRSFFIYLDYKIIRLERVHPPPPHDNTYPLEIEDIENSSSRN
jgi:hypothetical protein